MAGLCGLGSSVDRVAVVGAGTQDFAGGGNGRVLKTHF